MYCAPEKRHVLAHKKHINLYLFSEAYHKPLQLSVCWYKHQLIGNLDSYAGHVKNTKNLNKQ